MEPLDSSRLTETFGLLTHPHRRAVLYYLTRESDVVDVATLATTIADWEGDRTETSRAGDIEAIKTTLHHTHLPKLEAAGIVSTDSNRNTVELEETEGPDLFLDYTAPIDGCGGIVADD
ncbi:DUF7344 domain-containing protein [Halorientalis salina]|uniref:DUF7344 domain-containing protein n=1 Tax=Halorientalis salina TaxID=2932266 RepID=UPI0010ABBBA9|nr:ArsR family transcriptional regulator [Halorientalis salina]